MNPGLILRLQSSPLAFLGTKAEQKQKMTAHRYTTGTGASMRHRESSPTRPCLPTSRRVSDGGRHRPIGSSSWGTRTRMLLAKVGSGFKSLLCLSGRLWLRKTTGSAAARLLLLASLSVVVIIGRNCADPAAASAPSEELKRRRGSTRTLVGFFISRPRARY